MGEFAGVFVRCSVIQAEVKHPGKQECRRQIKSQESRIVKQAVVSISGQRRQSQIKT